MNWTFAARTDAGHRSDACTPRRRRLSGTVVGVALAMALWIGWWLQVPGHRRMMSIMAVAAVFGFIFAKRRIRWPHLSHLPFTAAVVSLLPTLATAVMGAIAIGVATNASLSAATIAGVALAATAGRAAGAWLGTRYRPAPVGKVRIAVVGPQRFASGLEEELGSGTDEQAELIGCFEQDRNGTSSLTDLVRKHRIDLLLTTATGPEHELFQELYRTGGELQVTVQDLPTFYERQFGRAPLAAIDPSWLRGVLRPRSRLSEIVSRIIDVVVVLLVAVPLVPLVLVLVLLIRRDGGPAIYRQRRVGKAGYEFEMLKLRSMRVQPERTAVWSSHDDDRITPIGRFLRATHLDEAPQLVNVLRGDMSLVGPRPEQPEIVAQLREEIPYYEWRHQVRPGLTGWAQVLAGYCGTEQGAAIKTCYDLFYLKYRSVTLDLLVLGETIRALVADRQWRLPVFDETFVPSPPVQPAVRPTAEPATHPAAEPVAAGIIALVPVASDRRREVAGAPR